MKDGKPTYDELLKITKDQELEINHLLKKEQSITNFEFYFEESQDLVCLAGTDGFYKEINPAFTKTLGYTKEELFSKPLITFIHPDDKEKSEKEMENLSVGFSSINFENRLITKNGGIINIQWTTSVDSSKKNIYAIGRDSTEKRKNSPELNTKGKEEAEVKLIEKETTNNNIEESEKRFRALVENNDGIITVVDKNLSVLFRSPSSARITGYSDKEFDEISDKDYFHPDYLEYVYAIIQNSINNPGKLFPLLFRVKHKKGHYIWLEGVVNNRFHDSSVEGIIANFRDVTDRIEANATITKERDFFAKITATSPGLIYSMRQNLDGSFCYPYASEAIKEIYGFRFEEIKNNANKIFELIHPDDIANVKEKILNTKTTLVPLNGEYRYFHPKKGLVWHEVNSLPVVEPEGTVICHGIITDITEKIEAKQKLLKANRLYLFISQINQMIVRTNDQETLFRDACNIAVDLGNFKMAWIGLIDSSNKNIFPVMVAGNDQKYFEIIKTITTDNKTYSPSGIAAREGIYCVCNDIENDLKMAPWKEEALIRGFKSLISVPIKKFENVIGVFNFYASEKNFFVAEEIALLEEATGDVAFALELFDKERLRDKAELEVFESEQRYHTLTEVSPVGIFRSDTTGHTTFVNSSWSEISGLSFEESIGNGWLDAVHEDDKQEILNGWKNPTYIGEKSMSEYRFVRPDGSIAWVMGQTIPEKNKKNEIIGYIGTVTDITERKQSEENIKNMHKKMEAIFEAIPDILFEVDINGLIYNYHSNKIDVISKSPNNFVGKVITEILPPHAAKLFLSAVKEASEKGFSNGKQYKLHDSNETHWFELSIAPMRESENYNTHFICLTRDITKAKESDEALFKSKERYEGLLSSLDAAIVVHAPDTSVIMTNNKASKLLGIKLNKIIGKKDFDPEFIFINEDNSPVTIEKYPVTQIINAKEPIKNIVFGIKRPNKNKIVWVNINGFPMLDFNGEISEIVISFIDITERKQMEIEIKKAKVSAENANKAKTDFLANMSHEIRTPLNGIIGFTHLLMKSNLEKNQLEYMTTVNESATSLLHIVNDVLDFSKIESGKLELYIEELNLLELINQAIDLFKYQADQKNIKLILTIEDNVPEYIFGDSVRLKQVLVNLLSNALKFTNFGEIRLDITEITKFNDECELNFSVKDTGIGIQLKNNEKIFSSFVQEDNSTSRKFGGTGLGLSISNQLLDLMDSKLQLNSIYGEGSDFYFIVKFKKSIPHQNREPKLIHSINDNEISSINILSTKKILIVEDNKINMLLAKTLVKKIIPNCILIEAKDGIEAIEEYLKTKPDIILMDIQMPNKNGYDATYEIRKLESSEKIPIIALTAGILTDEREKCFESGMNDFLAKPIVISELKNKLLKWLVN